MDPRQQLLQSLMRDLESFQLPERYTAAQKAQIEKGRKGQKDIDAGRAAIADNERLYQDALAKRESLQTRIGTLQGEIETAGTKAKQDDPLNQGIQYGKALGVPAAGYVAGHYLGHKFGKNFDDAATERRDSVKTLADRLRNMDKTAPDARSQTAATVDTYDKEGLGKRTGRSPVQFVGPAALGALSFGTQAGADYVEDPYLKEGLNLAATAERTGAGGMMFQQLYDTLRPSKKPAVGDVSEIEAARLRLKEPPPAPPQTPEGPALRTPSDRLTAAARAAGAKGKLTKKSAAEWLTSANINDANRAAVATELGVGPGQRIATAVKRLSTSRTASSLVGPLAAAGLAYDAASSQAEAAGADPASARVRGTVAGTGAAGIAAGGSYGLSRLAKALGVAGQGALGIGGGMSMPQVAMSMGPETQEDANRERSNIAVNYPWLASILGLKDEMGQQLPERAPVKDDEFATARALQIPEGIPLPQPDGEFDPRQQMVDQAMNIVRRAAGGRVSGGFMYDTGGRTDNIPLDVVPGAYIIPADVVSALGQGNTMAGIKVLDNMFPPQMEIPQKAAAGGRAKEGDGTVPIIVAGGEFKIDPYHVAALGNGNVKQGADALDAWIKDVRQQHIDTLSQLPAPAQ